MFSDGTFCLRTEIHQCSQQKRIVIWKLCLLFIYYLSPPPPSWKFVHFWCCRNEKCEREYGGGGEGDGRREKFCKRDDATEKAVFRIRIFSPIRIGYGFSADSDKDSGKKGSIRIRKKTPDPHHWEKIEIATVEKRGPLLKKREDTHAIRKIKTRAQLHN